MAADRLSGYLSAIDAHINTCPNYKEKELYIQFKTALEGDNLLEQAKAEYMVFKKMHNNLTEIEYNSLHNILHETSRIDVKSIEDRLYLLRNRIQLYEILNNLEISLNDFDDLN